MNTAPFQQVHAFVAVARHRSFSGAARELGVSRSAVSQSVRQLEEELRVVLLARTTRSVSLTEAGRRLLDGAGPAMGQALATLKEVSAQPGITLGEKSDDKVLVATTGRVRVKVDASKAPIQIGDLLVTSDVPSVAMKSIPVEFAGRKMHMPGTIIGKALEPLEKGKGEILVLLSLQ